MSREGTPGLQPQGRESQPLLVFQDPPASPSVGAEGPLLGNSQTLLAPPWAEDCLKGLEPDAPPPPAALQTAAGEVPHRLQVTHSLQLTLTRLLIQWGRAGFQNLSSAVLCPW